MLVNDRQLFPISDVDECTDQTDNCDSNSVCTNTESSFTCECDTGFSGDGVSCDGIYYN